MNATANLPAIPSADVLCFLVKQADNAVVGTYMTEAGPVMVFSDTKARDAYTATVAGNWTEKGQFQEDFWDLDSEEPESVTIAYAFIG